MNHRGEHNPMQQMQKGKNTPSGQILLPKIQPNQLMLQWDLGGRTEEKQQELQNIDPTIFPHLEEILFGGVLDLDLLSCFPKFGQESSEGSRGIELSKIATMVGREKKSSAGNLGKKPFL